VDIGIRIVIMLGLSGNFLSAELCDNLALMDFYLSVFLTVIRKRIFAYVVT
jgi:hypothetical protein